MRLFIVDDNKAALDEYARFFEGCGFGVIPASTMREALAIIGDTDNRDRDFDVALLDMRMLPGDMEGGLELLREIRRTRPTARSIILTAFGNSSNEAKSNAEGLFAYVDRRMTREEVLQVVEYAYRDKEGIQFVSDTSAGGDMGALGLRKGRKRLSLLRAPLPRFKRWDIVAKTLYLGVCGTDVHRFACGTTMARTYSLIGFHEAVGQIVAKGADVDDSFKIGDWVIPVVRRCHQWLRREGADWDFHVSECRSAPDCARRTRPDMCPHRPGYLSRGTGKYHGFASEYFSDPTDCVVKVSKSQRATLGELCVLTEPLSVAWKLVREIEERRGIHKFRDRVLILGIGPIGMFCLAVLAWVYPGLDLHVVDICKESHYRALTVYKHFARRAIFHRLPRGGSLRRVVEGKFDIIIDATGDVSSLFPEMCEAVSPEGILGLLSISDEHEPSANIVLTSKHFDDIVSCGVKVIGSVCASKEDMEDSLRFMEDGKLCPVEFLRDVIYPKPMLMPKNTVERLQQLHKSKNYLKIAIDASGKDAWPASV